MGQIPANSVALYRICTEKSVLGFGKYADLKVGDILKIDEEYIVWAYASLEKISFHRDILDRLGLPTIPKPGTETKVLFDWRRRRSAKYSEEERMHGAFIKKIGKKREAKAKLIRAERSTYRSRGELQAINHGHRKG